MKQFHICTITNKRSQYEEMKASFIHAGFDESRCRYTLFDNSAGNIYYPTVFNEVRASTSEPYIIFCHQDILLNQGDGYDKLIQCVEELNSLHPNWSIAGNAGVTKKHEFVAKITDPNSIHYPSWIKGFPQEVEALDENFLVIRTAATIACTSPMFYFYAHELCLDSILQGYSCHVIDFHLTHLSPGKYGPDFQTAVKKFHEKWSQNFTFYIYQPLYAPMMCFSKYKILQILGSFWVFWLINQHKASQKIRSLGGAVFRKMLRLSKPPKSIA